MPAGTPKSIFTNAFQQFLLLSYANFTQGITQWPTKREAQEWAAKREAEIAAMRAGKVVRWTLSEVLDKYIRDISPVKASADKEILRLRAVQRCDIGSMVMQDIGPADLASWRDGRLKCVKPASVLREIGSLRAAWKQAKKGEWGYVDHDPWPEVTKPTASPPRETVFLEGEPGRIADALGYAGGTPANRRQEAAVALMLSLETAMRAGEIIGMQWKDVTLEKRIVRLPKTKNGDAREVPLSRRAIELIESMKGLDEERVFTLTSALLDAYYRQGRELAGIRGPTFHDARATALTRLSKKLDILELAKMVGHRDPRSLMIYYRQSATEIAAKLD